MPGRLADKLAATLGADRARELVASCMKEAGLNVTATPQDLLSLSERIIAQGGFLALFGRSLKVHALLAGAKTK